MIPFFKKIICTLSYSLFFYCSLVFSQADSTNLPGLSTSYQTLNNTSSGGGVPDAGQLNSTTTYTETMVQACPSSGGNGYGYYPNDVVPSDGTSTTGTVNGGVIYDRTVSTNRFGTTTYGAWYQVNFLCTAIPYPPGCLSGQIQTAAPYWNWGNNSWQGLQCAYPNPPAPSIDAAQSCIQAIPVTADTNGHSAQQVFQTYYGDSKTVANGMTTYTYNANNGKGCGNVIITTCTVNNTTGATNVQRNQYNQGACNQGGSH